MLRVLQSFSQTPSVFRSMAALAIAPVWNSNGLLLPGICHRSMAKKNKSGDDEDTILPEGRKNRVPKKTGLSSQAPVRAYLDVIKFLPMIDHFTMLAGTPAMVMPKADYDVRLFRLRENHYCCIENF